MLIVTTFFIHFVVFASGGGEKTFNILIWSPLGKGHFTDYFSSIITESRRYARYINSSICEYTNCFFTMDLKYLRSLRDFDAIVFHAKDLKRISKENKINLSRLNRTLLEKQRYVFMSSKPSTVYRLDPVLDDFFHFTWTYKLDSDIYLGPIVVKNAKYAEVIGPKKDMHWLDSKKMSKISKSIKRTLSDKQIAAVMIESKCDKDSNRARFIQSLRKEMLKYKLRLDTFGSCGKGICSKELKPHCYHLIELDYYFYLAFEESFDQDYVSESLLNALSNYAVPVVYGGANYSRFMPDGAYLNAVTLGPLKLAKEMNDIIMNKKKKYYNFFKWRKYYTYHSPNESPETDVICQFCELLNDKDVMTNRTTIKYLSKWWNEHPENKESADTE